MQVKKTSLHRRHTVVTDLSSHGMHLKWRVFTNSPMSECSIKSLSGFDIEPTIVEVFL